MKTRVLVAIGSMTIGFGCASSGHLSHTAARPPLPTCAALTLPPLSENDPAYPYVTAVTAKLMDHGFTIGCIFASRRFGSLFEGQQGATTVDTNFGVFEAVFLAPPENFNALHIKSREQDGRHLYMFSGLPRRVKDEPVVLVPPHYFIKHENWLLAVPQSRKLFKHIKSIVREP